MIPMKHKSFSFGRIINSMGLLILVLLWILPTIGLFVSSFRDKDQLALTGWWTALSTAERNEFRRTGIQEDQVERNGKYVIAGNLLEPGGKKIQTFSTNYRNLTAHEAGDTVKFKDSSLFTLQESGDYEWVSNVPFKHERGKRIFYVAKVPPTFSLDNYREVLSSEGVGQSFINTLRVTIPATVIPIMIASFAAYAFAWMEFPWRRFLFVLGN